MDYRKKYFKYKSKYLKLPKTQVGGKVINLNQKIDSKHMENIKMIANEEFKTLNEIGLKDFSGLYLRLYERNNDKKISYFQFIPSKVSEYMNNNELFNHEYEEFFKDIYKTPLKDLILDFGTDKKKVKVALYDNYPKKKQYFDVDLPIKFTDFMEKLFDHFDVVGLPGYPDNGGIDSIKYDKKNDIYLVHTWS